MRTFWNQILNSRSVACFGCQIFKKWPLHLGRMYQTAYENVGFNALRFHCSKLNRLPACAMIPNQQNFTRQDERFNFSTIFSGCQIGQVHVIFKSDQAQWHSSWSSFLTESKIFWTFRLFSPNFRHFSRRFRRIQSWYQLILLSFTRLSLARWRCPQILTFVTRNLIGSFVVRCAFWLVSRKDHCLKHVLRKSFWIKKLINTISLHLLN